MLPTVFAYRDDGPQAQTRWKPRRVFCTLESNHSDAPGILYVVKFAAGQTGAAALISEVVSTRIFALAGFRTLSSAIVRASEGFAASCNRKSDYSGPVSAGDYYGTSHRDDVEAGPPPSYDDLAQPLDLLRLWVFDSWLCNIDREIEGNILLSLATRGRFHLIAADQSDCFCGDAMRTRGPASSVPFLPNVIYRNGGPNAIRRSIVEVRAIIPQLRAVFDLIPESWWQRALLTADAVGDVLASRANRLEEILNPTQWEVPNADDAILL
jgi:hypothetical protein